VVGVLDDCGDYGYSDKDPTYLSRYLASDECSIYVHDEEIVWEDEDTVEWRCRNCGAEGWDPR
jgi:hypothetical protein